jgi:hypothetical protein
MTKFFEVHDEVTNKSLLIKANNLDEAIGISETICFDDYEDGAEIGVLDDIDNHNALPDAGL